MPPLPAVLPACVVLAGFAGALDSSLCVGDVVVDAGTTGLDLPTHWTSGTLHTSDQLVTTPAQKQALFAATGAAAVDMESGIVKDWATRAGVPLVVIRAISDAADQPLSERVLGLVGGDGGATFWRVLMGVTRYPTLLLDLARLGRAARTAGKNLGAAVREFIESYSQLPGVRPTPT